MKEEKEKKITKKKRKKIENRKCSASENTYIANA